MKNIVIVTGGAGFVGTNLIELFIKNTKLNLAVSVLHVHA